MLLQFRQTLRFFPSSFRSRYKMCISCGPPAALQFTDTACQLFALSPDPHVWIHLGLDLKDSSYCRNIC